MVFSFSSFTTMEEEGDSEGIGACMSNRLGDVDVNFIVVVST